MGGILAEPFLINFGEDRISAAFIPDFPISTFANYQVDARPDRKISIQHPSRVSTGNFRNATTRFYPFITQEVCNSIAVFTFQLLKISYVGGSVSINLAWSLEFFEGPAGVEDINSLNVRTLTEYEPLSRCFCADREYAVFVGRRKVPKDGYIVKDTIYLVPFEDPKIKSINLPFSVESIFLVDGTVFVTKDDFDIVKELVKLNFDTSAESEKIESICNFESYECDQYVIGRNLYMEYGDESDPTYGMMFLDKSITKNHQERITSFKIDRTKLLFHEQYLRYNNGYRLVPKTGSCWIDACLKEPDCRFLIYIDDPSLLQAEIEQCISSSPEEKVDEENKM